MVADMVADMEVDKVTGMVAGMEVDKVAGMVAGMEVDILHNGHKLHRYIKGSERQSQASPKGP